MGNTLDKEIVLKSLKREMRDKAILEDVNRLDDMLLALDVLIKETQEEFRAKSIQPYRRQAISTATLAFLTIGIFFVGAIGISWISRSIKRPLMKLTKISSAISQLKGDLTHDLDIEAKDEIGDLAHAFNQMLRNLANLMRDVREVSLKVVESSNKIKEISQTQAEVNLRQSSQVNEAKSLIENLGKATARITEDSNSIVQSLNKNLEFTKGEKDIVQKATQGIEHIKQRVDAIIKHAEILKEKSSSIDKILGWLEEISKKIDLVALNFNIEVSKSEEVSEGFSVLGKEVRSLSESSQEATKEIKSIIGEIQTEINNTASFAVEGIQEIKRDLKLISQIKEMTEKMDLITGQTEDSTKDISQATQEQKKLSTQAVDFIAYIQQLSKESLAQSQEIENLSKQIDALSHQLKQAVGEFRLD